LKVATHVIAIMLKRVNRAANLLLDVSLCPERRSIKNFFIVVLVFLLYILGGLGKEGWIYKA